MFSIIYLATFAHAALAPSFFFHIQVPPVSISLSFLGKLAVSEPRSYLLLWL